MGEARKHIRDMESNEIKALRRIMRKQKYDFTEYSLDRTITRGITTYEVMKTINDGEIIEFHVTRGYPRVLLRGQANKRNECTCVVIDLGCKQITTSYKNHVEDRHRRLNYEIYTKQLNIVEVLTQTLGA